MIKFTFVICFEVVLGGALLNAQEADDGATTKELGFEVGQVGEVPAEWFVPTKGWRGELTDQDACRGERSAKLSLLGESQAPFGNLMHIVDAADHGGRHVRLSAKVRVIGDNARAMMWLRVDRPDGRIGFFDNMGDRPLRSSRWTEAVIEGEVDADVQGIALGVMSLSGGTVYIDDVRLEFSAGVPAQAASPPRPVTDRGLENLRAATRLLAYVRFFHPSDEAAAFKNWDHVAVQLMEAAEPMPDAEQLARCLQQSLAPLAPSLAVWAGGLDDAPPVLPAPANAKSMTYWVHHGAGRVAMGASMYSSERKRCPLPGERDQVNIGTAFQSLASQVMGRDALIEVPESPYLLKSLGASVCCRLPVLVYVGDRGSLPRPAAESPAQPTAAQVRLAALNRSTRLAGVALCWGVMQHFYPYFDVVDTDWDAALTQAIREAAEDVDEVAYLHTLQRLVGQLHDGHGRVFHSSLSNTKVLPILLDWSGAEPVVIGKQETVPAAVAVGDVLLAINGQSVDNVRAALSPRISAATEGWCRTVLCQLLRMHASHVDSCPLRFRKPDGSEYEITLPRCAAGTPIASSLERPANGAALAPGILYFDLNGASAAALNEVLADLEAAQGIVFDLRGYPADAATQLMSHLHDQRTASARWNIPVVTLPDREGWKWHESAWDLPPRKTQLTAHVAFLTDGRAVSYAESIMGIVEHYRFGDIVGGTTAGTNGNVNPFDLPGGFRVMWTGMRVLKHDGSTHHGVGIRPTVPIQPTAAGIAAGRDEVLERAVEILQDQIKSAGTR